MCSAHQWVIAVFVLAYVIGEAVTSYRLRCLERTIDRLRKGP